MDDTIVGCRRTLTTLSGPGAAFDALRGELGEIVEIADIAAGLDVAEVRLRDVEDEQSRLSEEACALRDQIAVMERDVATTEKRQLREDLLGRLTDAAERWSVATLSRHLLRRSRETYEAAHRPAVIETAEHYFTE